VSSQSHSSANAVEDFDFRGILAANKLSKYRDHGRRFAPGLPQAESGCLAALREVGESPLPLFRRELYDAERIDRSVL
jgi:hypothetical protein